MEFQGAPCSNKSHYETIPWPTPQHYCTMHGPVWARRLLSIICNLGLFLHPADWWIQPQGLESLTDQLCLWLWLCFDLGWSNIDSASPTFLWYESCVICWNKSQDASSSDPTLVQPRQWSPFRGLVLLKHAIGWSKSVELWHVFSISQQFWRALKDESKKQNHSAWIWNAIAICSDASTFSIPNSSQNGTTKTPGHPEAELGMQLPQAKLNMRSWTQFTMCWELKWNVFQGS